MELWKASGTDLRKFHKRGEGWLVCVRSAPGTHVEVSREGECLQSLHRGEGAAGQTGTSPELTWSRAVSSGSVRDPVLESR